MYLSYLWLQEKGTGRTTNFSPFSFVAAVGSGILDLGSGMEKSGSWIIITNKYPNVRMFSQTGSFLYNNKFLHVMYFREKSKQKMKSGDIWKYTVRYLRFNPVPSIRPSALSTSPGLPSWPPQQSPARQCADFSPPIGALAPHVVRRRSSRQWRAECGAADAAAPRQKAECGAADAAAPRQKAECGAADAAAPRQKAECGAADAAAPKRKAGCGAAAPNPAPWMPPILHEEFSVPAQGRELAAA
jgi:hypothetical protein